MIEYGILMSNSEKTEVKHGEGRIKGEHINKELRNVFEKTKGEIEKIK